MVVQLVQFQEDSFGKNAVKPAMTRLPIKCFLDFRPNGALCHILATVYRLEIFATWKQSDFKILEVLP